VLGILQETPPADGFVFDRMFGLSDNLFDLFTGLVLSTLLTLALVQTYRATHRGATYSASFLQALFILTTCTTLIMVVIGSNIARAFSLVGALSIVRFRTAIKDPRDVGFVFAALALGMACGTGFYLQAVVFTLFLCALMLALARLNVGRAEATEAIVRVTVGAGSRNGGGGGTADTVEAALRSADVQPVLINRVLEGSSGLQTISWRVRAGDARAQGQLQERLRSIEGVQSVGVFVMDDFHVL
jgi:hypothetical protein